MKYTNWHGTRALVVVFFTQQKLTLHGEVWKFSISRGGWLFQDFWQAGQLVSAWVSVAGFWGRIYVSNEKMGHKWLCRVFVGDEILPSYVGIIIKHL